MNPTLAERLRRILWPWSPPKPQPPADPMLPAVKTRVFYGDDPLQYIDIYMPARRASQLVDRIDFTHGGGWRRGDADSDNVVTNKVACWNPLGVAFCSISYRLGVDSTPPVPVWTQAQDVALACSYLRVNAKKLGLSSKVARMGHSAGAHLAMLVATHPELQAVAGPCDALVSLDSAALNVPGLMSSPNPDPLYVAAFGNVNDPPNFGPEYQVKCSPYDQLTKKLPPLMLVHSLQRGPASEFYTQQFDTKARGLLTDSQMLGEDLTHGEINKLLGLPSQYTTDVVNFVGENLTYVAS